MLCSKSVDFFSLDEGTSKHPQQRFAEGCLLRAGANRLPAPVHVERILDEGRGPTRDVDALFHDPIASDQGFEFLVAAAAARLFSDVEEAFARVELQAVGRHR